MKHQRLNNATFLLALVFTLVTTLLHKKEASPIFFSLHAKNIFSKHVGTKHTDLTFERGQHHQKIERKKLRIRYTGSEVTFHLTEVIKPFLSIAHPTRNFSLHATRRAPLHLRHIAALRAPPVV